MLSAVTAPTQKRDSRRFPTTIPTEAGSTRGGAAATARTTSKSPNMMQNAKRRSGVASSDPTAAAGRAATSPAAPRGSSRGAMERTAVVTAGSRLLFACAWCFRTGEERSEEHTSELQSRENLVCRLLLE